MSDEDNIFDFSPTRTDVIEAYVEEGPDPTSPEWQNYVMGEFLEGELIEINGSKYPNCYGLRRVTRKILGDIKFSTVETVYYPNSNPPRTVVKYSVGVHKYGEPDVTVVSDIASVSQVNTDDLFLGYPEETAATRAEGRCLRKILMLNCVAAEELTRNKNVAAEVKKTIQSAPTDGSYTSSGDITPNQIRLLKNKCSEMGIDPLKFVNTRQKYNCPDRGTITIGGSVQVQKLEEAKKQETIDLIKLLHNYQNNSQNIPKEILI